VPEITISTLLTNEASCGPHKAILALAVRPVAGVALGKLEPAICAQNMVACTLCMAHVIRVYATTTIFAPGNAEETSPGLNPPLFHFPAIFLEMFNI
jgi:hypothetical protein